MDRYTLNTDEMCGQIAVLSNQEYKCHVKKGMHNVDPKFNIISHGGFASYEDAVNRQRPAAWSNYEQGPDNG